MRGSGIFSPGEWVVRVIILFARGGGGGSEAYMYMYIYLRKVQFVLECTCILSCFFLIYEVSSFVVFVNLKHVRFGDQCVQKKYDQLLLTTWGVR